MKNIYITATILLIALLTLGGLFGCGQDAQILQPSVEEPEVSAAPAMPVAVVSVTHFNS